jgi:hypothetical protein
MGLETIVLLLVVWFLCKVFGGSRAHWTDVTPPAPRFTGVQARPKTPWRAPDLSEDDDC